MILFLGVLFLHMFRASWCFAPGFAVIVGTLVKTTMQCTLFTYFSRQRYRNEREKPSHALERRWLLGFEIKIIARRPAMSVVGPKKLARKAMFMNDGTRLALQGSTSFYRSPGLGLLSSVFFLSGAVSLVYQVVWQRLLTLYYGVGPISTTLIVSVYMLGLGIGALVGGHFAPSLRKRLVLYMVIELALGLFGMVSPYLLISIGRMTAGFDYTAAFFCMFSLLCIPTILMGMTLPLLVQIFASQIHDFQHSVSFLYFINTLGAAIGAILASFGLISFIGLDGAAYAAAAGNFILAALIFVVSRVQAGDDLPVRPAIDSPPNESLGRFAFAAVFVTGFLALAYEIIWFRIAGVLIKDTSYAFSSILAVYLVGVAFGSKAMDNGLRRWPNLGRRNLFFLAQALIGLYVVGSVSVFPLLARTPLIELFVQRSFRINLHPTLPSFSDGLRENSSNLWSCVDIFVWPAFFCLVPTLLMGATFPLLSVLAGSSEGREARIVGKLYFWNILGNVAGGMGTAFILLPLLGSERAILALSCVGLLFLFGVRSIGHIQIPKLARFTASAAACIVAVCFAPGTGNLYRAIHYPPGPNYDTYLTEGGEGVVMTYVKGEKVSMYIGGSSHGGRPLYGFNHEAIDAMSYAPTPRRILVIGFGTGSIVETVLKTPGVESVSLVELNRTVLQNLSLVPLFADALRDNRLKTIIEDGRRYLLQTDEQFDAILIDPLRSTTAYSGNLYSREFFALARTHLKPDGVFMVWFDEHDVLPRTIASIFPHVRLYKSFALASASQMGPRNEERRTAILASFSPEDRKGIEAINDTGKELPLSELPTNLPVNTDLKPVTEYYLGPDIRRRLIATTDRLFRRTSR